MKIQSNRFWELIHAKFGQDESDGQTCGCEHCLVIQQIKEWEEGYWNWVFHCEAESMHEMNDK